jgi:general secretion pathway protein E
MPLVTDDPTDPTVINCVGAILKTPVMVELAPMEVVRRAINEAYAEQEADFGEVLDGVDISGPVGHVGLAEEGDLLDTAARAPVVKLVNMILFEAVKRRASDVHVHPLGSHVQVRYRIDGVLYDYLELPSQLLDEVTSRIKVLGQMDIAEKRLAQDGRTTVTIGDKSIDLRISIIPTSHGERAVLRLLDKSARLYELPELGMSAEDQQTFEGLIQQTHGIMLVTGPTGSGKSTTLYAALQYLDCKETNILTLEDPIEYQLPGISQTQVSTKKGMTFATGLRAVLRQDPDIIMVGEIRDEETARMAVQSSLTGHLVFSTLHTNNAAGAVSRLLDLGIEPYLVASSLLGSLAQRLVRVVCPHCCAEVAISQRDTRSARLDPSLVGRSINGARGCDRCGMTGYCGRRGIFELLSVDESIRELVVNRAKTSGIEACAITNGMTTLRQDAVRKLLVGETTVEEVSRVTQQDGSAEKTGQLPGVDLETAAERGAELPYVSEGYVARAEQQL